MYNDLDHITFAEWLVQLNAYAAKNGYQPKPSLVEITGQLCWYAYYDAGFNPADALNYQESDGVMFGADYLDD